MTAPATASFMVSTAPVGTIVQLHSLQAKPELNGRSGRIVSELNMESGRLGVQVDGVEKPLALKPFNLTALEPAAAAAAATTSTPPRTGGSWDDLSEQQLQLALSDEESRRLASSGPVRTTLQAALSYGLQRSHLRIYANAPRYDRLVVASRADGSGVPGAGTYTVEAQIDAWEGRGWWLTRDGTENELTSGLVRIDAAALAREYAGALAFLEACKRLGAPRYVLKPEFGSVVADEAKPHVIEVVEKVIASSSLRFLLSEDALERADA
jgi:hypothetical protein